MSCWTPEGGMHCQPFRDLLGNFKSARPDSDLWDQAGCQWIVGSVPCCVQLFCTTLCTHSSSTVWQGVLTSGHLVAVEHVYFLCVFMCVLLAVQHINLREGNFPVAHWLISLCLYIQLHWTSCSVEAVFRYLFLMFLLLFFFFHSFIIQTSGSSDSQHTCPACKYLKGSFQTLGPFLLSSPFKFSMELQDCKNKPVMLHKSLFPLH